MRPTPLFSAACTSLLLCTASLAPFAAKAAPAVRTLPALPKPSPKLKKPPFFILNDHLERIPKTYIVYGLRSSINEKMVCTDRLGHPTMSFPTRKAMIIQQEAASSVKTLKAARALLPSTTQSASR